MIGEEFPRFFSDVFKGMKPPVLFILIGLVVVEKFLEADFVCPCDAQTRAVFFFMYLVTPAFIAFTLAFYVLRDREKSTPVTQRPGKWLVVLQCCIPSLIWGILFLSDGRYVACLSTKLEGENADSSLHPAWEWCDQNRTLTGDQKHAQKSFYTSKVVGFVLLFVVSFIVLIYKCCEKNSEEGQASTELGECTALQVFNKTGQADDTPNLEER